MPESQKSLQAEAQLPGCPIIDDKNKTIYVIKESVGGENKVSNIIEKLILKDIKNNLTSKEEVNHYDGN